MTTGHAAQGRYFVSYASADKAVVDALVAELEGHGVPVWYAPRDVPFGGSYAGELIRAIDNCSGLILLLSTTSNASRHVESEVERAFRRVSIYPVRIEDIQPSDGLSFFINTKHWCDAFGSWRPQAVAGLAAVLRSAGATSHQPPPDLAVSTSGGGLAPQGLMSTTQPPLGSEEAQRLFIGPGADRYMADWRRMSRKGSNISWKWPAFLFGPFWLAYRRMLGPAAIVLAGLVVVVAFAAAAPGSAGDRLANLVGLGVAVWLGISGTNMYRRHAAAAIQSVNAPGADLQTVRDELNARGGTSWAWAIGSVVGYLLVALVVILVIDPTAFDDKTDTTTTTTDAVAADASTTTADGIAPAADAMATPPPAAVPAPTPVPETAPPPASTVAPGVNHTVTLTNNSSNEISEFNVSLAGKNAWEADALHGKSIPARGGTRDIQVDDRDGCMFDFHARFSTGEVLLASNVNTCTVGGWTYSDKK